MNDKIVVSICTLTYNHEPYIRECLDGFLMQETNFPFEVLIHDDASTDKTADIIREYEAKYPDIIKPIYQTENQYSKGTAMNIAFNFPRAEGKYIAMCEGDDYWTDPLKLQKQVDFLEKNNDYSMCFTNAFKKIGDDLKIYSKQNKQQYSVPDLINGCFFNTCTVTFRNDPKLKFNYFFISGDLALVFSLLKYGKVYKLLDNTATYRVHPKGVSQTTDQVKWTLNTIELYQYFNIVHEKQYNEEFQTKIRELYGWLVLNTKERFFFNKISYLFNSFILIRSFLHFKIFIKNYLLESFYKKK